MSAVTCPHCASPFEASGPVAACPRCRLPSRVPAAGPAPATPAAGPRPLRLWRPVVWGLALALFLLCLVLIAALGFFPPRDSGLMATHRLLAACSLLVGVYCVARALDRLADD